jgi:4-hydroxy-4-methyl-2-oxoglutarate aldolase
VDELAVRLARLDTCTVSDALDRLGLTGTVHEIRPTWTSSRVAGRVVTVQVRRSEPGEEPSAHLGAAAIELSHPGDVIVVAAEGMVHAAGWGGLMSLAATLKGVEGIIVDGACRDVDDSRELGLPVFARTAVPTTGRGRVVEVATQVPVTVAGVHVSPGDLIVADASGVVFVSGERAEEVLAVAADLTVKEARMASELRLGRRVLEVLGTDYERLLKRL